MVIGIDFDGTCVKHRFPEIDKTDIGSARVLKKLVDNGHKLILFTMRSDIDNPTSDDKSLYLQGGNYLSEAIEWFNENDIPLYGIQTNPTQHTWTKSPKAYCDLYIDDAAIGCPLIRPEHERPYVNWNKIEKILENEHIIFSNKKTILSTFSINNSEKVKAGEKVLKLNNEKITQTVLENIELETVFGITRDINIDDYFEEYIITETDVVTYELNPLLFITEIRKI